MAKNIGGQHMADSKAIKIWEDAWKKEIHTTDYALKRIQSAKSAKLTPIKIDTTDFYGYFQGGHGRYEAWLDYCPCGDFHRSGLPCKHIYRLAIELGLMNIKAENNPSAIVTPKNERISLDKTIDIVEKLSIEAQHALLDIASNITSTSPTCFVDYNEPIIELIKSGIIIEPNPEEYEIPFGYKNDITKFLDSENISYEKKAKVSELKKLCIDFALEKSIKTFGKRICVSIPTHFNSRNIHYYLHRKYDSDIYYDENMDICKIQLLDTDLPDDAVTNQLIIRGYYSRKEN